MAVMSRRSVVNGGMPHSRSWGARDRDVPRAAFFPILALTLALASSARGAPFQFDGSFSVVIQGAGAPVSVPLSGTTDVTGGSAFALDAGLFSFVTSFTIPSATVVTKVHLTGSNQAGAFSATPWGGFGGQMPLTGIARLILFGLVEVALPLDTIGNATSPYGTWVSVGEFRFVLDGDYSVWNTWNVEVSGVHSTDGHDARTAAGGGEMSMVTPFVIWAESPTTGTTPHEGYARLTLDFSPVPEPTTATLLLAGLACLAIGKRRIER